MAQGNQSKEGLFELLTKDLETAGFSAIQAAPIAISIIDHVIPDQTRESELALRSLLFTLGRALIETSIKI